MREFYRCENFPQVFSSSFFESLWSLDKILYQLAQSYHRHHFMELHAFDLFDETLQLKDFLGTKTHWIAIHACKELAFQIVDLWNEWAPKWVMPVPCSMLSFFQKTSY